MRAAEEHRSALIFRALASAARAAGIPSPWPAEFARAAHDELRHVRLCAAAGEKLGAPAPIYDARPVRDRLASLPDPMLRVAALLLVEVAIGETISMSLFRAGRRSAAEPLTRALLTAVVADEVRHQQLGWSGMAAIRPMVASSLLEALEREASWALAAFERQNVAPSLRRLQDREFFDPAHAALGVLAPEARVEAFYSAVENLVLPRLDALGLDGSRAWTRRHRAPVQRAGTA
jgi:hypothetical protein